MRALAPTARAKAFRTISKRHVLIRFSKVTDVQITDRSRHGTFLDGERIETVVLGDLDRRAHVLRLGAAETLRLASAKA